MQSEKDADGIRRHSLGAHDGRRSSRSNWRDRLDSLEGAHAQNTIVSHRFDFTNFENWCRSKRRTPLPATVAAYVEALGRNFAPATIQRHATAISRIHRLMNKPNPADTEIVRMAIRRLMRARGRRQKQVLGLRANLRDKVLSAADNDLRGLRDRTLIASGYDGRMGGWAMGDRRSGGPAFRRSN